MGRERESVAVGVFEPGDLVAVGCGPDAEVVLLEEAEAEELDAFGGEGGYGGFDAG